MSAIVTSQYQNWRVTALLKGLGFTAYRSETEDEFENPLCSGPVFDGWEPSKDGSRITDWEDLGDPESPHFQRRYLTVFRFTSPDGFEDVIVWSSSPHRNNELYAPIALGSYWEWKDLKEEAIKAWLEKNKISL